MPAISRSSIDYVAAPQSERLPAWACMTAWFATSGGIWVAIIALFAL